MRELPESMNVAEQLGEAICGKRVQNAIAGGTPHGFAFYHGDPAGYHALLTGKVVQSVRAMGMWVNILLDGAHMLLGDGANLRYYAPGEPVPEKHQLWVEFEDFSAITCTVQMYGGIHAYRPGEMDDNFYYQVALEKPSPLTGEFSRDYFAGICGEAKPTTSAKALLATEQRIPGLGNGVLQDILFRAGIHPKTKQKALSQEQLDGIFVTIKNTLAEMTAKGGRDTEKDLFGCAGGYTTLLSAKTYKKPCPVCGGEIVRQAYLGGNVYFCPVCQPEQKA